MTSTQEQEKRKATQEQIKKEIREAEIMNRAKIKQKNLQK